ncbi:MAG: hypothetical protein F9K48_06815 [Candidatus Brocadia sp.]|nr:MAG: hypothetical protein F9K48_06815 [Candidatus Brocadia sp.]
MFFRVRVKRRIPNGKKECPFKQIYKRKKVKPTKSKAKEPLKSFPIVGIGASAGGLEAIEGFFTHMPSDTNIAFIIIQHLAPQVQKYYGLPARELYKNENLRGERWNEG